MIDFLINAGFFVCGFVVSWIFLLSREWIFIPFDKDEESEEAVIKQVLTFALACGVKISPENMEVLNDWDYY